MVTKGADFEVGGCPAHTLYVNLSPTLLADSAGWSKAWHEAFEKVLYRLCVEVVSSVLSGHPLSSHANELRGPACRIRFRVSSLGTRIVINVFGFVGPHDPGPDGGTWQPRPTVERVLAVYIAEKAFSFVTFYGPPLPGELGDLLRRLRASLFRASPWNRGRGLLPTRLPATSFNQSSEAMPAVASETRSGGDYCTGLTSTGTPRLKNGRSPNRRIAFPSAGRPFSCASSDVANLHSAASGVAKAGAALMPAPGRCFINHAYACTAEPHRPSLAQLKAGWRGSSWRNPTCGEWRRDLLRLDLAKFEPGLPLSLPWLPEAAWPRCVEHGDPASFTAAHLRPH